MEGAMNDDTRAKLKDWVSRTVQLVKPGKPFNIHFDELLGRSANRADMIDACSDAFSWAVNQLKDNGGKVILILMIPLTDGEAMSTMLPSWEDIKIQRHSTPPSIYLVHREDLSRPERTERYQSPISFDWMHVDDDRYFACYKTWRQPGAPVEDGWVREVFVEFNPPSPCAR
jgi:hypothetical protein